MSNPRDKHLLVKNRRKLINPVFHLQSQQEDEKHLSKETIKDVKKTGVLKLHAKHLSSGKTL